MLPDGKIGKREYYEWPKGGWIPIADYLILAGNIGNLSGDIDAYGSFLEQRCSEYKYVFLVLGNHEFMNQHQPLTINQGVSAAKNLERDSRTGGRLVFLNNTRFDLRTLDGAVISILGCTLWSKIRADQEDHFRSLSAEVLEGIPGNSARAHTERFEKSFKWLQDQVKKIRSEKYGKERKILVITHYPPFIRGASRDNSPLTFDMPKNYSQDWNDILGGCGIEGLGVGDMWVYGHTHHSGEFEVDDVRVFSNQRGSNCPALIDNPEEHDFDITRSFDF